METQTPTKENNFRTGATGENTSGFRGAEYYANQSTSFPTVSPTVAPATPATTPITSSNLAPVKPVALPNAQVPTYGGVQGATEALVGQAKAQPTPDEIALQEAEKQKNSSLNQYLQAIIDQGSISSSVDRSAQDAAKRESDKYTSMLEQEQLATRRRLEEIQRGNISGAERAGQSDLMTNIQRDSLSKQADIAILQTAANRNYDTAASIADRQVALKMEQSNANLNALKFFYENNKADFDKKDDRLYKELLMKKENENKKLQRTEEQIAQLKLNVAQYGGGLDLLNKLSAIDTSSPKAFDEAIKIAGKYASDPLEREIKRAQLGKLNAEIAKDSSELLGTKVDEKILTTDQFKKAQSAKQLQNKINETIKIVNKYGNYEKLDAEARGAIDNAKVELRSLLSTALDQGVVQPGESEAFDKAIGSLNSSIFKRDKATIGSLQSALKTAEFKYNSNASALEGTYGVTKEQLDKLTGIVQSQEPSTEEDVSNQYMQAASGLVWSFVEGDKKE